MNPDLNEEARKLRPFIGWDTPSLESRLAASPEETAASRFVASAAEEWLDLPQYDIRRYIFAKDPLAAMEAFRVYSKVVLASLHGMRMCPACPHCAEGDAPCIDTFGSCAEPQGGSIGRADVIVGAVEAQKAEGALHTHYEIFVQSAWQMYTLADISRMLQARMIDAKELKEYLSYCRKATYPDTAKFQIERDGLEK